MKTILTTLCLFLCFCVKGQIITTWAGGGAGGGTDGLGDGLHADSAKIPDPGGMFFDKYGNCYVVSALGGNRIRKIDTNTIITSVVGTGMAGFSGDGGLAIDATLNYPSAVTFDSVGNMYIVETGNNTVRKVNAITGIISTIAGNGIPKDSGDGGLAIYSELNDPQDICIDKHGNLYIATWGGKVRKITPTGIISTFAGNEKSGYSGDGSHADTSAIGGLTGICIDDTGNIYLASQSNSRILKINTLGIITSIAGTNTGHVYNGDNIPATTAQIDPARVAVDHFGNLFFSDQHNYRVRKIDSLGTIHTVAGDGMTTGGSGDGGLATSAVINYPVALAFDNCGSLYISEINIPRIRKVTFDTSCHIHAAQTSVQNVPAPFNIKIYPNPTTDILHIEAPTNLRYRLMNMLGTIVQQGVLQAGNTSISVAPLPSGIYMLELSNTETQIVRKIVKE